MMTDFFLREDAPVKPHDFMVGDKVWFGENKWPAKVVAVLPNAVRLQF